MDGGVALEECRVIFTGDWSEANTEKVKRFFREYIQSSITWRLHAAKTGAFMAHPWGYEGCLCADSLFKLLTGIKHFEEALALWRTMATGELGAQSKHSIAWYTD